MTENHPAQKCPQKDLPSGPVVGTPRSQGRGLGLIPGLGRSPGEGHGHHTPVFLPGEFHEQRSLVGYSPQGPKESGTTEHLTLSQDASVLLAFPQRSAQS